MFTTGTYWNKINAPIFPWALTVDRIFGASEIPYLTGPSICVISDYAGDSKGSAYQTISILVFEYQSGYTWDYRRQTLRKRILKDKRRMSYKNLGDTRRQKALPFLDAADEIRGICATFVISKKIGYLCFSPGWLKDFLETAKLEGGWNARSLEQAIRVVHFVSLLLGGVSHPGQNVFWVSDEDFLFANQNGLLTLPN